MRKLLILWLLLCSQILAATRYVDGNLGSDCSGTTYSVASRNCSGSDGYGYKTVTTGVSNLASGDTLDIRAGTYVEHIAPTAIPSGGGEGTRTVIQGHTAETATLAPVGGDATYHDVITIYNKSYITIKNLTINQDNVVNYGVGVAYASHHIRIEGNNFINCDQVGVQVSRDQTTDRHHIDLINNTITMSGIGSEGFVHNVYMRGTHDCLIEGNTLTNGVGYGIFLARYQNGTAPRTQDNIIRNNKIYNNKSRGIDIEYGDRIKIYNNLIYDNNTGTSTVGGIFLAGIDTDTEIYNNTIYNNKGYGIWIYNSSTSNTQIRNNIIHSNTTAPFSGTGTGTVYSNNICSSAATGCAIVGDPSFQNVSGDDYRIVAGSLAIDAGCQSGGVPCTQVSSVLTTDYAGVTRANGTTTGSQYDIGAYEYQSPPAPSTITVTAPNGGESVQIGQPLSITWNSVNVSGNVHIELTRNGSTYEDIAASTANDGTHDWSSNGAASTTCKVKISDVATGTVLDQSDNNFTLAASVTGTITILSPITGQITLRGSDLVIRWTSTDVTGNVKIELSRDNGTTWTEIVASTAYNSPDIIYTATGPSSSQSKIRVTSLNDPSVTATSGAFRLGSTITLFVQ